MGQSVGPILIVDDNRHTRDALERILGISGYAFISASGARAALDYLGAHEPVSAIVLDMHMPGMDGHEFLRKLRNDRRFAEIPVVVFSCDPGDAPDAVACVRKGIDDPDVLLEAIAACYGGGLSR